MKLLPYLLVSVILLFSCKNRTHSTSLSTHFGCLEFSDTLHNFGQLNVENPVDSFDFKFTNNGEYAIVVLGVSTSCDCTKAKYDHVPVMPGESSYIRVVYDGTGHGPEYFSKTVSVTTSATNDDIILSIEGELK